MLDIWLEQNWWVKATVALLAAAAMTYPQWLPRLVRLARRTAAGLTRMRRRVTTTVDAEQTRVELFGDALITASVFVSMRNLLGLRLTGDSSTYTGCQRAARTDGN